jgi:hypothetical protein
MSTTQKTTNTFNRTMVIGVWSLVSYEVTDDRGNTSYPMGKDAEGFIMYHPEGYMSAQIMTPGRPKYASGDLHTGTQEEMAAAAHGYLAYAGPYQVDEENKTVKHHMSISLNTNWLGDTQPRYVELEGDILSINSEPIIVDGKEVSTKLVWKKAQDQNK